MLWERMMVLQMLVCFQRSLLRWLECTMCRQCGLC